MRTRPVLVATLALLLAASVVASSSASAKVPTMDGKKVRQLTVTG